MINKYIDDKFILKKCNVKKNNTINNNTKNERFKNLIANINQKNIKNSIIIAAELHLSGYFDQLLSKIYNYYFNEINICEPLGIIYINKIITYYNSTYCFNSDKGDNLKIINESKLRNFHQNLVLVLMVDI